MSGPWEKYNAPESSAKPWEKYGAPPAPKAEEPSMLDNIGSALKGAGGYIADKANAIGAGVANGAYLGYRPQVLGARNAVDNMVFDAIPGSTQSGDSGSFQERYLKNRDKVLQEQETTRANSPIAFTAGELAGGAAIPIPGTAETTMGRIGLAMGKGAGYGVAMNPGDKQGEINPLQAQERGSNLVAGGLTGGVLEGGLQAAGPVAKKGMSLLLGPSEEGIGKYLQNSKRINEAPSIANLKDTIDAQVGDLKNNVLRSEAGVAQAQGNLSTAAERLASENKLQSFNYKEGARDAQGGLSQALDDLKGAQGIQKENFKEVPHPRTLAPDVNKAVGTLKEQVVKESEKARNILEQSGSTIEKAPLVEYIKQRREKLFGSTPAITDEAKAAEQHLDTVLKDLELLPDQIKGTSAKDLLRQIDEQTTFDKTAGGFSSNKDQTFKGLRFNIDSQLKNDPAYSEQMKKVAAKTSLLEQASDLFGDEARSHSAMAGINHPNKVVERRTLQSLGEHTGQDFMTPLSTFEKAEGAVKGGFTPLKEGQAVERAQTLNDILSAPGYRENRISQAVGESGLPKQVSAREAELAKVRSELEQNKAAAEPFRNWAPGTTQNKLQSLVSKAPDKASIEAGRELSMLNETRPEGVADYLTAIDDNRVRKEFSQDRTRGSRNAIMYRGLGLLAGGALGHVSHIPGAELAGGAAGGLVGGYVDKHGGEMAKSALDHYLNNQSTYNAIQNQGAARGIAPWLLMQRKDEK